MALSSNTALQTRNRLGMSRQTLTVTSAATLYKHGMIARLAAGTASPCANATTTTFVGIAEEAPTGAGDGTITVTCINDLEVLMPLVTAITVGNNGAAVYAVDDQTVTTENTLGPEIGTLVQFVATNSGWVRLRAKALVSAS